MPGGPANPTGGPAGTPPPAISNTVLTKAPRAWLVKGFQEAHDRFNAASQDPQAEEALFTPLFEALAWAAVLEEDARPHNDPVLMALRFARDRVLHDWALAVEGRNVPNPAPAIVRATGTSQIIAPAAVWEWFWKRSADLPKMGNPFAKWVRKQDEKAQYDAVFADKPVRGTLEALRAAW